MKVDVRERDTGTKNTFEFEAVCDGEHCGNIKAHRTKKRGYVFYAVTRIDVDEKHHRKGVGTKLYEAAAQEACRRRGRLASTERNPGAFSNDFWRKQMAKNRAFIVERHDAPNRTVLALQECPSKSAKIDLSGVRRKR